MRPTPNRRPPTPAGLAAALVLAAAVVLAGVPAAAGPAAPVTGTVASAAAALDDAVTTREAVADRVAGLEARQAAVRQRLETASEEAAALTNQIAEARRTARRRAVEAYVNGGAAAELMAFIRSEEIDDAARRTTLLESQTRSAVDAAADFQRMKDENDPAVAALAVELDEVVRALTAARNDLVQAEALQADAERALDAAEADAAAEAAAAAREAAEAAAPTTTTTAPPRPATTTPAPSRPRPSPPPAPRPAPARPVPPAPRPPSGGWEQLRQCESSGNYQAVSRSGRYRGAYQFSRSTWDSVARRVDPTWVGVDPAAAPPAVQDMMAFALYRMRGSRPWPHCGRYLG